MMPQVVGNPLFSGIDAVRKYWGWFLSLGIALTFFGVACIVLDVIATFATVLVFGLLLLISGIFQLIHSFRTGTWSGFFLYLLSALFRGFTGYLLVRYPLMGAEGLTLVLASFLIVAGLFRAIGSGIVRFPLWGWFVFSGVVTTALGAMLLAQMPVSGIWFVGFAVGLDLMFDGIAMTSFATAVHSFSSGAAYQPV